MKTCKDQELLSQYLYWKQWRERRAERPAGSMSSENVARGAEERKSTTVLQLQAQRRNVQHSTGPRTLEGKRRSSLNSTKWRMEGIIRQTTIAIKGGNPFQFRRLQRYLLHLFQPWDVPSQQRVAHLARVWWKKIGEPPATPFTPLPPQYARVSQMLSQTLRPQTLRIHNRRISAALESCFCALASHNRQWKYVLSKRLRRPLGRNFKLEDLRRIVESDLRAANIPAEHRRVVHFRKSSKNPWENRAVVKITKKNKLPPEGHPFKPLKINGLKISSQNELD